MSTNGGGTLETNDSSSKNQQQAKKVVIKKDLIGKKVDPETARVLTLLRDKLNKKNFGRKVSDAEIIAKAIKLLEPEHLRELQEATYSEQDRLHLIHEDFVKQNGKISLDQFIGKLIRGEITLAR